MRLRGAFSLMGLLLGCAASTPSRPSASAPLPEPAAESPVRPPPEAPTARELAELPRRQVAAPGDAFTGEVEAAEAPTFQTREDALVLSVPLGTRSSRPFFVSAEPLEAGGALHRLMALAARRTRVRSARITDVRLLAGAPAVFAELTYRSDTPGGESAGQVKMMVHVDERVPLVCTHDEPGYAAGFARIAGGRAGGGGEDGGAGGRGGAAGVHARRAGLRGELRAHRGRARGLAEGRWRGGPEAPALHGIPRHARAGGAGGLRVARGARRGRERAADAGGDEPLLSPGRVGADGAGHRLHGAVGQGRGVGGARRRAGHQRGAGPAHVARAGEGPRVPLRGAGPGQGREWRLHRAGRVGERSGHDARTARVAGGGGAGRADTPALLPRAQPGGAGGTGAAARQGGGRARGGGGAGWGLGHARPGRERGGGAAGDAPGGESSDGAGTSQRDRCAMRGRVLTCAKCED